MELRQCNRKFKLPLMDEEDDDEEEKRTKKVIIVSPLSSRLIDEVLVEIFVRLPTGRLAYQCKTVCKHWNSLISSSYFTTRYINHHLHNNNNNNNNNKNKCFSLVFRPRVNHPLLAITNNTNNKNIVVETVSVVDDFIPNDPDWDSIEGSCRDLLLCRMGSSLCRYSVVNIFSRRWTALPPCPAFRHRGGTSFKAGLIISSDTCCDGECDDLAASRFRFRVIRVPVIPAHWIEIEADCPFPDEYGCDLAEFRVQVFCSETWRWDEYVVDWYPFRWTHYLCKTPFVSHGQMIHWLNGRSLLSIDPFSVDPMRLRRALDLPEEAPLSSGPTPTFPTTTFLGFGPCGPNLHIVNMEQGEHSALRVWQLEETETVSSMGVWRLIHRVLVSDLGLELRVPFNFLGFHPYDGETLFLGIRDCCYGVNLRTRRCEKYPQQHKSSRKKRPLENVIPPLFHQWLPTPLPPSPLPDS